MAYKETRISRSGSSRRKTVGVATIQSSLINFSGEKDNEFYEIEPAEVIDIILDNTHEYFKTYEDIGKIKLRMLYSETNVPEEELLWAKPINSNIKQFPLKHEIVRTGYYISREGSADIITDPTIPKTLYYFNTINTLNSINNNCMLDISTTTLESENTDFGNVYKDGKDIYPLLHKEGDLIIEGRSGNSIRFGSENGDGENPWLLIRNGQNENINLDDILTPIEENINEDGSSIWFINSKEIDLEEGNDIHKSVNDSHRKYSGKQILLNSDSLIFNCKDGNLIGMSSNNINFSTSNIFGVDSNSTVFNSDKIFLGLEADEPVVLGDQLKNILGELIDAIQQLKFSVPSAPGVTGPLLDPSKLIIIKNKLPKILSRQNYTL